MSNALNTFCPSIFRKNVCLQLMFESIETQFWVTKTVWQRIPSRRARHRKAPTIETVQSIARYNQLPLSGRTQMLTASDFCCECTTVHEVRRSSSMETSIHEHCELKSYSIDDIKPVELVMHWSRKTTVVLPSVSDDTGSWIHHSLQLVCYDDSASTALQ